MSESTSSPPDATPREPGLAAKCGEKMLGCLSFLARPAAPLLTRQEAVVQGFGAVILSALFSAALIACCLGVAQFYVWFAEEFLWTLSDWEYRSFGIRMFAATVCAGAGIGAVITVFNDSDHKWRTLNWICFTLVASWLFHRDIVLGMEVLILLVQFLVHACIHSALKYRDDEAARVWQLEREQQRQLRHSVAADFPRESGENREQ